MRQALEISNNICYNILYIINIYVCAKFQSKIHTIIKYKLSFTEGSKNAIIQ